MKTRFFFFLFSLFLFLSAVSPALLHSQTSGLLQAKTSKTNSYDKQWKQVDSLYNAGLPKSAIEIVDRIYSQAKKEGNKPEYIKAIIYRFKLQSDFQEDVLVKTIQDLKTEIRSSSEPVQQILTSILAEVYWKYYQNNRYRFQGRTQIQDNNEDSIQTWDLTTISNTITKTYLHSLDNPGFLKGIPVGEYTEILSVNENQGKKKAIDPAAAAFRPTIYDILAWRSLDYFMSNDAPAKVSASAFQLDDPGYFSLARGFIKMPIDLIPPVTSSMEYYAITILRDLTAFHFNDKNPQALIDGEFQRFSYLLRTAVVEGKDSLYLLSLKQFEKDFDYSQWSTDISYAIANFLFTIGQEYRPLESEKHKWDIKSSVEYCENAIRRFPESDGAKNCRTLEENIRQSSLEITTENAINPDKPSLGLLEFRNISTVWFRLIKADPEATQNKISTMNRQEILKYYTSLAPVKSWSVILPTDGDLQKHSVEFSIPAVSKGYYILLCSSDKDFGSDKQAIAFSSFYSTQISYISQRSPKGGFDFYILDRETGNPLPNVAVESWTKYYNYSSRRYESRRMNDYNTDNNGFFSIPQLTLGTNYSGFFIKLKVKDDFFITDNLYQYPFIEKPEKPALHTYFFTDRTIYRPGQTIYFKGIIIEQAGDDQKIKPDLKTTVTFTDVNYQKISEQTFITNEFGSFNGMFIAPQGVLLGQMTISNGSGSVALSVEEYKRPTFTVTFNPLEGNYRVNDSITLKGKATGYAGNNIGGVSVRYRVVRTAHFPYWNNRWSMPFPISPEIEITNGTTRSLINGDFSVTFKAIPDRIIPRSNNPVFDYLIYADVTDINGETQSNQANVSAGYVSLLIASDLQEKINIAKDSVIKITTKNLNGRTTPANVRINITRLRQPDRLFRKRMWKRADRSIINQKDFYLEFPFDVYEDEDNPEKWQAESTSETTINTKVDSIVNLRYLSSRLPSFSPLTPGFYRMTLNAKDPFGENVETKTFFSVYDPSLKELSINTMNWFVPLKTSCEPGDKAQFLIGSKEENVNVIFEVWAHDSLQSRQWLKLNNRQMLVEIPVKEDYRGNCAVNFVFIRHNRAFQNSQMITVPYPSKKLGISFESFRDKLSPGQNEEWKITIKDPAGKAAEAEYLTTMYDESLDLFSPNSWSFQLNRKYFSSNPWEVATSFKIGAGTYNPLHPVTSEYTGREYPQLNWFGFNYFGVSHYGTGILKMSDRNVSGIEPTIQAVGAKELAAENIPVPPMDMNQEVQQKPEKPRAPVMPAYQVRRDFRETAFFYPALLTDKNGNISLKFTVPESLTKWKLLGFAHTKQLDWGQVEKEVITQKDLMVFPNAPRFVRQGDTVIFSAKVVNLGDQDLAGQVTLEFTDAITQKPVDIIQDSTGFRLQASGFRLHPVSFTIDAGKSENFEWKLIIPVNPELNVLQYHIAAKAENFTDAEENAFPVLTNRMLVTESLPLPVRGKGSFDFTFEKLAQTTGLNKKENTLKNYKLTLEFASNPAWYAIQALPLLDEPAYPNADNIFNAFYANSIASFIANSNPKIKKVFDTWKNITPEALLSNLEKNPQLKSAVLQETPWVMEAKSESQRKQRVAILFDLNTLSGRLSQNLARLRKMQSSNGAWPWFEGMQESRYITQNIVTGLGHLDHLGIKNIHEDKITWEMIGKAVQFLDGELVKDYENVKKLYPDKMEENHLGFMQIQYLYARSYFPTLSSLPQGGGAGGGVTTAFDYFKKQAEKYWLQNDIYSQGMIALALYRLGNNETAKSILKSLSEKAQHSPEIGMYWALQGGYEVYQAPVETESLLIEAYQDITADKNAVEEMKIWLLKQKQTQDWKTSRATAEACYALLLRGLDLLATTPDVKIIVGKAKIDASKLEDTKAEAGTGYFQVSWSGTEITPDMGKVKIVKSDDGVAWGALYWQYFEDLDKITPAQTPLKIEKKLYLEKNSPSGPALQEITDYGLRITKDTSEEKLPSPGGEGPGVGLKVGDKLKVRIILSVDRNLEFVHLKDMRAAAFEPLPPTPSPSGAGAAGVGLSGYRYQDGLGYYQSTTDVATNFFFDYLPKGTYVFEYSLVVNATGNYSNGISTVQCMYAPEFAAHSAGIRVVVK